MYLNSTRTQAVANLSWGRLVIAPLAASFFRIWSSNVKCNSYGRIVYYLMIVIFGISFATVMGFTALVNPRAFRKSAKSLSRWIDTEKPLAVLDKRVDIDHHVLRHCRLFGAALVVASVVLGWLALDLWGVVTVSGAISILCLPH